MSYVPCPAHFHCLGHASWAMIEEEGTAKIGVSDLFVKAVGGIRKIELARVGEDLLQGIPCAVATTRDGLLHSIMCPLSGQVLEVNSQVLQTPSLIERDPYFRGWLYQVLPSSPGSDLKWLGE